MKMKKKKEEEKKTGKKMCEKYKYTSNDKSTIFNALNNSQFRLTFARLRRRTPKEKCREKEKLSKRKKKKKKQTNTKTSTVFFFFIFLKIIAKQPASTLTHARTIAYLFSCN